MGKWALNFLAKSGELKNQCENFTQIIRYIRFGDLINKKDLWPIFHQTNGSINQLQESVSKEEIEFFCYQYFLGSFAEYTFFSFLMGIDQWTVILNEPFPNDDITNSIFNQKTNVIWYPHTAWNQG